MTDILTPDAIQAFLAVVMIDLVLAGDNAVVIGLAAAGLEPRQRQQAIVIGVLAATVLRIAFALVASQLMTVIGLMFAGGVLLLWVGWKMWREIHSGAHHEAEALAGKDLNADGRIAGQKPHKTLREAAVQIILADVSMSLDNVLGVAGAAREHPMILVFGLVLSITLMGFAANLIANLLQRHRWIAYLGLIMIVYVAVTMMWEGGHQVCTDGFPLLGLQPPALCETAAHA